MNQRQYEPIVPQRVAFLGLGVMGYPMAGHLKRAGHTVTVYNRTAAKAEQWVGEYAQGGGGASAAAASAGGASVPAKARGASAPTAPGGATTAPTPRQAAHDADIVFACVGNDDDLRSIVLGEHGALAGMKPGAVFVDHTTASAAVARELHAAAAAREVQFVDAPVSGGQAGAVNGALTVMCGGEPEVFARVQPVIMAFARACTLIGGPGAGQLAKMVNQICIAGLVQGLSEGIAFGAAAGLDMKLVLDVIGKGAAQSWQMDNRGTTMIEDRFDFGFAVDWMRKDLGLCLDEAKRNAASLPVTALVDQFYGDVQRMGGARWDTSSLIRRLRKAD